MHHLAGDPASGLDLGRWQNAVESAARRMRNALEDFHDACMGAGLCDESALGGFIHRMTSRLDEDEGQATNDPNDCCPQLLHKIIEGFKAWMFREAKNREIPCPNFGGGG